MKSETAKLDSAGRIVIPAAYRKALEVEPGDRVVLRLEDGELRVCNQDRAIRRAQEILHKYIPHDNKQVDEFIAERRREAIREEEEL